MIDYILHINGRGGSGKSTLLHALNERVGLEKTLNYTTRNPRYPGEQGYYFVNEAEFQNKFKQNEIIESYFRKSNSSFYGIPAPTSTSIVQSEIMGLVALRKWCFQNNVPFLSIYLDVDTDTLLSRLKKRSDSNELPEERLAEDAYYEVFKEWSDVIYDYNNITVEQGVHSIITMMQESGLMV
jgi:guanylate kinase